MYILLYLKKNAIANNFKVVLDKKQKTCLNDLIRKQNKNGVNDLKINVSKMELLTVQQGLNFGKLAEKANLSRQTISTIRGRKTCAVLTATKLAAALGVDVLELLEREVTH